MDVLLVSPIPPGQFQLERGGGRGEGRKRGERRETEHNNNTVILERNQNAFTA